MPGKLKMNNGKIESTALKELPKGSLRSNARNKDQRSYKAGLN